jgi:hypothetical protein
MISHVPTVAEQIERVLSVREGPHGSEVRLLNSDERDALLRADLIADMAASGAA